VEKRNPLSVKLDPDSALVLDQVLAAYSNKVPKSRIIALAWPRCPECNAPLVQKFASKNLVCSRCGKEFELTEPRRA